MLNVNDTIAATATPPGRGGIAVIRISGPLVKSIIQQMFVCELKPRLANYLPFRDKEGTVIDEGVAVFFPNPHSFTGEDVLELQGHGGPVVVDMLLQHLLSFGVRLARPGEFSERAFLNGKIDLTQAEAIADLIDASSQQAARSALRSLQGEFSQAIRVFNEKLIHLRMYIEAAIDFSDEEIDFLGDEKVLQGMDDLITQLKLIQSKAKQGSLLREGIRVVIMGEPNVGKSSLLNALSGKPVAIVTDIPGTTRDVLREQIVIDGVPLHIIDTAGLRESDDVIEQEGIRRAHQEIASADLIIHVIEADTVNVPSTDASCPVIYVRNKIDLTLQQAKMVNKTMVSLSAKTGEGIALLQQAIKDHIGYDQQTEGLYLARRRHLDALTRADAYLHQAKSQLLTDRCGELAAYDLHQAQQALSEITGEFTADDLLGRIFSSFCIGK